MSGFSRRPLGKTGLQVSPLGIGGGGGIESQDLLYAFEQGINYFFFSSDLHHFFYQKSADALRTLCKRGSSVREQVVLATVTYVRHPDQVVSVLLDQLLELGVEYVDVFHWGWISDDDDLLPFIKKGRQLKRITSEQYIKSLTGQQTPVESARMVNEELLKRGLARFVGASFHSRVAAQRWMRNLDVLMLRYNSVHPGAEQDVVPFFYGDKERDPGIVLFKTANAEESLVHSPLPGEYVPSIPTRYRFALSQPWVDVVLTGLTGREEIDQALAAVEKGPLSEEECQMVRSYGVRLREQVRQQRAAYR